MARAARRSHDRRTRCGHATRTCRCFAPSPSGSLSRLAGGPACCALDWSDGPARARRALPTVAVAVVAAGVMVASTAVWAVQGTNGRTASPSQLNCWRRHRPRVTLSRCSSIRGRGCRSPDVPGRLRIELSRALPQRRAGRETAPLFALPAIPAGRYRLSAVSDDPRGWLMVGIARDPRDPFALQTVPVSADPIELRFPVSVRALVIRGDEDAWRTVRGLIIEPLEVDTAAQTPHGRDRAGVRSGTSGVRLFPGRPQLSRAAGILGGGSRDATVVVQPVAARRALVADAAQRAGREPDHASRAGDWEKVLTMAPARNSASRSPSTPGADGEFRCALTAARASVRRKSMPASRDERFLWRVGESGGVSRRFRTARPRSEVSPSSSGRPASVSIW